MPASIRTPSPIASWLRISGSPIWCWWVIGLLPCVIATFMHLRGTWGFVLGVATLWVASFSFSSAAQVEAGRISITPSRFEFTAYERTIVEAVLEFTNGLDEAFTVRLEGADFRPEGESGQIVVGEAFDERRSLADWLVLSEEEFVVPAQDTAALPFSSAVPRNTAPGVYWGVVVVRTEGTMRLGSIVYFTVRGEAREGLSLESFFEPSHASGTSGGFVVRLRNTGETLLKPEGVITVRKFGREVLRLTVPVENVLPGAVRRLEVGLAEPLGFGSYAASLEVKYGVDRHAIHGETAFWVVPWRRLLVAAGVLMAGCGLGFWMGARLAGRACCGR